MQLTACSPRVAGRAVMRGSLRTLLRSDGAARCILQASESHGGARREDRR